MSKPKKVDKQRCVSPVARVSFPQVFKAKSFEDQEAKYSCTLLFPANADLSALKKAVYAAKVDKYGPDKAKWPKMRSPFNDGNEKADLDGYKNTITVTAKNKHKPQVVDQKMNPITEESGDFYAGCYAIFSLRAFCYGGKPTPYKPGVGFSLDAVQKHSNGEAFSGKLDAADVFTEIEDESEDAENYEDGEESEDEDDSSGW